MAETLRGLIAEWRKPSCGITSAGMDENPPRIDTYYNADTLRCADQLQSFLTRLVELRERWRNSDCHCDVCCTERKCADELTAIIGEREHKP